MSNGPLDLVPSVRLRGGRDPCLAFGLVAFHVAFPHPYATVCTIISASPTPPR